MVHQGMSGVLNEDKLGNDRECRICPLHPTCMLIEWFDMQRAGQIMLET